MKKLIALFSAILLVCPLAKAADNTKKPTSKVKIDLHVRKIRTRDVNKDVECYYVYDTQSLEIIFPKSEGWANMSISVPDGTVIFK